jgi:hypothetical protein
MKVQSSNHRYPQKISDTQRFRSIPRPRNVANYSEIPSTSSNRQTPSIIGLSNRLSRALCLPSNHHQSQLDSRENSSPDNQNPFSYFAALKSRTPINRGENTSSNDEDEKN